MRTDHKLNGWPTPPGRAPGASVARAASLDDRRNNDNSEPGHAFRVHAENGWVVVELPGYPPNCLGELGEIRERTGIAADGHPAGAPGATGVERLRPRENGLRSNGGERGKTD